MDGMWFARCSACRSIRRDGAGRSVRTSKRRTELPSRSQKPLQSIRPGGGRIKKCIQDNETKLSPACREAAQEHLEQQSSKEH
jgi:hypothetical protein